MPLSSNPKIILVGPDGDPLAVNATNDKLQVEVDGDITIDNATLDVNLDHGDDSVTAYGLCSQNSTLTPVRVGSTGDIQVREPNLFDSEEVTLTNANQIYTLGSEASCRTIDIMSDPANTGDVYIGGSSLSSSSVTGVRLFPGDIYSIGIANKNLIKAYGTVASQKISVNWFKYD